MESWPRAGIFRERSGHVRAATLAQHNDATAKRLAMVLRRIRGFCLNYGLRGTSECTAGWSQVKDRAVGAPPGGWIRPEGKYQGGLGPGSGASGRGLSTYELLCNATAVTTDMSADESADVRES